LAVLDPDTALFTSHHIADIPAEEIGTSVTFDIHQTGEDTFVISVDGTKTHFSTTTVVNLWDGLTEAMWRWGRNSLAPQELPQAWHGLLIIRFTMLMVLD
jgi:hypothetical protein